VRAIRPLFLVAYCLVAAIFGVAGLVVMGFAVVELWQAVLLFDGATLGDRGSAAIDAIGMVAVALVALEISQTVVEEEVVRQVHVSAPTRVRRYLSRFLVVVVVALAIESLVAVMQALHREPEALPYAGAVAAGAAALLAAWGLFLRLNRSVEELEPEGIAEARGEDHKVQ
jgi:ABC-type Fe3+-siderophore transport system permease subunit